MNELKFSIGILSWQGYDSLVNSLFSYEKNGLSQLTDQKFICLPEFTKEGIKIAEKFNYQPILITKNIGILGGFKKLAEVMPKGPLLLLENDLELIEKEETTFDQLKLSLELLSKHQPIQIRLRSRLNPGEPFVGIKKYNQYWSDNLFCSLKRLIRPTKAKRLIGTSTYILDNPEERHPNEIKKLSNGFYLVSSSVINWANLAILVDSDSYLNTIIKKAEAVNSKKHVNGFKNIEIQLNNSWWRQKEFKILVAPGLFKHNRLSYRGY